MAPNLIALTFVTFAEAGTHGLRMAGLLSVHHGGERMRKKEDRRREGKSRERMPDDASVDPSV